MRKDRNRCLGASGMKNTASVDADSVRCDRVIQATCVPGLPFFITPVATGLQALL